MTPVPIVAPFASGPGTSNGGAQLRASPTKVTFGVVVTGVALASGLSFGTAHKPQDPPDLAAEWTTPIVSPPAVGGGQTTYSVALQSPAEQLHWIREHSGLTWDQLAKVFGVSRRAVHMWAAGKAMTAGHEELLADFVGVVRELPGESAKERRSALIAPTHEGPSIFDQLRMDRARGVVLGESYFAHIREGARGRRT